MNRWAVLTATLILIMYEPTTVLADTYATWDPAHTSSDYTISNGNLTVTKNTDSWVQSQSTICKSTGKWYVEITQDSLTAGYGPVVGVGASGITGDFTVSANGYGYAEDGRKKSNNTFSSYGSSYTTGDVIGVYFDADAHTVGFTKNGTDQGQAFTGLPSPLCVYTSQYYNTDGVTANFGPTMAHSHSTYNDGLFDTSGGGGGVGGYSASTTSMTIASSTCNVIGSTTYCITDQIFGSPIHIDSGDIEFELAWLIFGTWLLVVGFLWNTVEKVFFGKQYDRY